MKNLLNTFCIGILFSIITSSCSTSSDLNESTSPIAAKLSADQESVITSEINREFAQYNLRLQEIIGSKNIGQYTIINWKATNGNIYDVSFIGIARPLPTGPKIHLYCVGTECGVTPGLCGLEGPPEGGVEYVQCKCSGCEMVGTVGREGEGNTHRFDINQLAVESYNRTFNANETLASGNITITAIDHESHISIDMDLYTYSHRNGKVSTFAISTEKVGNPKQFVVDCTGTCDCRERYFPATGAIECTCSDCSMLVKEL